MSALLDISTDPTGEKKKRSWAELSPTYVFFLLFSNARGGEIEEIPKEGRKSSEDDDDDDTLRSIDRY